ncbi:aspartate/glutamate racemase family protein [Pseudomonas sp. LJDD11]|uniref:aspartate/glutamate racemase family protein n=1 Tax=Pseudomonas sp. LJDD11 TaxID=2931984 RepID=UPI00211C05E4|nr:aspartate/glutamate racemase family protein [Pseudomonas sp. LJDD11]MCQ9424971.1 aspartate/glutamate racemase family protein [Pseudomonas sp. LJDD11]
MNTPRIFLVHATPLSISPINTAFDRHWPQAELVNLLEDSLPRDLKAAGQLTPAIIQRFLDLTRYAVSAGADAILFTCSAFGEAIDACKREVSIPLLKPNEAMIEAALAQGSRIGLLATFEPTLASMRAEFIAAAERQGQALDLQLQLAEDGMQILAQGDGPEHDRRVAQAADALGPAEVICLAQFSMARASEWVRQVSGLPVLTTPDSAVLKLRSLLDQAG